jgi:hypothetical protein
MTPVKLTKPQEALLRELANGPKCIGFRNHPRYRLLSLGFITYRQDGMTWWTVITDAGREWIKERDAR